LEPWARESGGKRVETGKICGVAPPAGERYLKKRSDQYDRGKVKGGSRKREEKKNFKKRLKQRS